MISVEFQSVFTLTLACMRSSATVIAYQELTVAHYVNINIEHPETDFYFHVTLQARLNTVSQNHLITNCTK